MLINEILLEDDKYGRTKAITVAEFRALIPQLQVALDRTARGHRIYRGSPNPAPLVYTDPTKVERVSRNTTNELTLLVSHILPSWQEWPKRSRSLICSESYDTADTYSNGGAYIVLPLGDPNIAVVPGLDFWDGFDMSPPDFNHNFGEFLRSFRAIAPNIEIPTKIVTVQEMVQVLKTYDAAFKYPELVNKMIGELSASRVYRIGKMVDLLTSGNSIATLDEFFSPERNSFRMFRYSQYENFLNYEVWFSAPAVLVRQQMFNKLMN